jgi:hypothetical protein
MSINATEQRVFPPDVDGLNDPAYLDSFLALNPPLNPELEYSLLLHGGRPVEGSLADVTMEQTAQQTQQAAQQTQQAFVNWFNTNRNFLIFNPLSQNWTWAQIRSKPLLSPLIYISGMIGYALSLPIRIAIFVVLTFRLIGTFFTTLLNGEHQVLAGRMKVRALVFLGAAGELVFGAIGMVCPVAAYKGDEWVQSNSRIHAWYRNAFLSFWSYEIVGRRVTREDIGIGGEIITVGNEHRMELLKEEMQDFDPYFLKARKLMNGHIKEDEINGMMGDVLEFVIPTLGMLNAVADGHSLEIFLNKALEKCNPAEKEDKERELKGQLKTFETYWNAVVNNREAASRLSRIPIIGHLFPQGEPSEARLEKERLLCFIKYELFLKCDETILDKEAETKQDLENKLNELKNLNVVVNGTQCTLREAVAGAAKGIRDFAKNVTTVHRELLTTVTRAAYPELAN